MAICTWRSKAIKEVAWLAKECRHFELEIFVLVQVVTHTLVKSHNTFIHFIDTLVQLKVLLFNEAHLHKCRLVTGFESGMRFDQIL